MQDSQIIRTEYSDVMKKSYIDYAMSVIVARALPMYGTGLSRFRGARSTTCTSWVSGMTGPIGNAPVSWGYHG